VTPIEQTRTGRHGNCQQAALASLLDLPLDDVPDFCNNGHRDHWYESMCLWLLGRGKMHIAYPECDEQWPPIQALIGKGLYYCISGPNEDGIGHVVIYQFDKMVWDPNPSRRGVATKRFLEFIFDLPAPAGREE